MHVPLMKRHPKLVVVVDRGRIIASVADENGKAIRVSMKMNPPGGPADINDTMADKTGVSPDTTTEEQAALKEKRKMQALRKVAYEFSQLLVELEAINPDFMAPPEISEAIIVLVKPHRHDSMGVDLPDEVIHKA